MNTQRLNQKSESQNGFVADEGNPVKNLISGTVPLRQSQNPVPEKWFPAESDSLQPENKELSLKLRRRLT